MRLSELTDSLKVRIQGNPEQDIKAITNDSRKVTEGSLYFAIPGAKVDGATFIPGAIRDGAKAVVTEWQEDRIMSELGLTEESAEGVTFIHTDNARLAMGIMSSRFYGNPSEKLTVIGITGTKGKTTTSYMIRDMLEKAGHKTGLVGTIEIIDGKIGNPCTEYNAGIHKASQDFQ